MPSEAEEAILFGHALMKNNTDWFNTELGLRAHRIHLSKNTKEIYSLLLAKERMREALFHARKSTCPTCQSIADIISEILCD